MEQKVAVLGLIAASLIWAIGGISYKIFLDAGLPYLFILWVLFIFRFISVWVISDFKKVKHEIVDNIPELKLILLNGLFGLATPLFFIAAILYTSLSTVYFIAYTAPAWVLVFAVLFLGEKINLKKLLGLALTIIGVCLITNPTNISLDIGMILAFLSALTYAGDIITGRELKDYSYHTVSIYATGFRVICLTIAMALFQEIPPLENIWGLILLMAIIGLFRGLASDFYYYALEKLEASIASIITLAELIFASVIAFLIFNETHTILEITGYTLIIIAGLIILLRKSDIEHFEYLLRLRRKH